MRVLLDAHMLGRRETGNETYVLNLLREGQTFAAHGIELWGALPLGIEAEPSWAQRVLYVNARSDLCRLARALPSAACRHQAVLLHLTYHAPFWGRLPYVVTVHDTSFRTHPHYHTFRNVLLQNLFGALSLWRARAVITVSEFCRAEIERLYPFVQGRVFVTPEAASAFWYPREETTVRETCQALGISKPYFLWVGKFQPRKNVLKLAQAYLRLCTSYPHVQLVLAGDHNTPTGIQLKRKFAQTIAAGRIVLTGYLTEEQLACLYSGCVGFVFPSLYEGFGLPVLEAMQCGAPVIASNVTALPEVAGDAAVLVSPTDELAIESAMKSLLGNPEHREVLRQRSQQRAACFSWRETAARTVHAYLRALS